MAASPRMCAVRPDEKPTTFAAALELAAPTEPPV